MAYADLGVTYQVIGDNDSAIKSYQTALEKKPGDEYLKSQLKLLQKQ